MPAWRPYRRIAIPLGLATAFLAVHIFALILLGERSIRLSFFIAAASYLPAIALIWRQPRIGLMRLPWLLWIASLTMEMLELLWVVTPHTPWLYLPSLFEVVSFLLCLIVVATPSLGQTPRSIRITDLFLAVSICALCLVVFLQPKGVLPDSQWLVFLTLLRVVAATAALLAMRAATSVEEYTLMRFIALFEGLDVVSTFVLNQIMGTWLHQTHFTYVDFFLEVPTLGLALALVLLPACSFRSNVGRSRFLVRSGLPFFFSLTLLALALWLLPKSHVAGIAGIAIAIVGYAVRSTLAHGRVLETEEQLRLSVDHLRKLADRDPLTNVGNRRTFDHILRHHWPLATPASPLALILMDLDLFKQINDSMGHLHGDRCLRAIASVLELIARRYTDANPAVPGSASSPTAHVCRFGGDEFAIILPSTSLEQAILLADRVCLETRAIALKAPGGDPLTVSVGVAASSPVDGHTISSLIAEADDNLHRAKRAGRNRIQATSPAIPLDDDHLHTLILRVAALALRAPLPPR